jgi:hypothetical protein
MNTEKNKQLMIQLLNGIKAMPYFKNYAAASGAVHNIASHEKAVEILMTDNGLAEWKPIEKPNSETVWNWINTSYQNTIQEKPVLINTVIPMPDYSYVSQPCGTHDSPDFIIKLDEAIFMGIECKSVDKGYTPMYNSGGIKQPLIYVFCSKKTNSTTMYCGKDIMTLEQQQLLDELIEKQRIIEKEYNEKLKECDVNHRGISYYTRPMIQQSGGAEYTNYFTHRNREKCEQNVYEYVNALIEKNTAPPSNTIVTNDVEP